MPASRFLAVVADFITDDLPHERDVLGDIADVSAPNAFSEQDLEGHVEHCGAILRGLGCIVFSGSPSKKNLLSSRTSTNKHLIAMS